VLTFQDFLSNSTTESAKMEYLLEIIDEHKSSIEYVTALNAEQYYKQRNVTIMNYQKWLYKLTGQKVEDTISPNYKLASNYFNRFITQLNQYLLGNGVTFSDEGVKEKLGSDFDTKLQIAGREALIAGVSFGFWNNNKLEIFKYTEFAPLKDEETGLIRAGVYFWQLDSDKPMRITLYEEDGITEYIKNKKQDIALYSPKRAYKVVYKKTEADGIELDREMNYPGFPIVPLYGNPSKQSELVGMRNSIDAYDFIKSGFANDLDGHMLYWVINNAGGMEDKSIAQLIERIKMLGAAISDDEATITPKEINIPYESRITYLDRLEDDLYKDFGALKVEVISAGATTATQIDAAYLPLDCKADEYEFECIAFIRNILALQGIDSVPQFKRNQISNMNDLTTMILTAANYLDDETILKHLPFLSPDEINGILERKQNEEAARYTPEQPQQEPQQQEQPPQQQDNMSGQTSPEVQQ